MSKTEIIEQLSQLSPAELAEVQAKLDELAGTAWQDGGELSDADKEALDQTLAEYEKSPDAGSPWEQVKARVRSKLQP
jgi:putative addiction module component (TIGR02574 family)